MLLIYTQAPSNLSPPGKQKQHPSLPHAITTTIRTTTSLMQKPNRPRHIPPQPTHLPKTPHLLPPPPHKRQKPLQRTARPRAGSAVGEGYYAVVDVDPDVLRCLLL